jgi:coenzyme F420-0:L-glutamate ligase/coenzyme F420-1:gamma-L-glutamate ligase
MADEHRLEVLAPDGIGEITAGSDLAALVAPFVRDGDVWVVTSKVVSKAEGRVVTRDREQAIHDETVRVVARRGPTSIVETRLGVVMAAAGVDASNVAPGSVVLLPVDPDASARRLREQLAVQAGVNVAVVVSDTAGRAWRHGQTDLALGVAGMLPLESFEGAIDPYGNPLAVTAPAVADEIAGIAEVASGKLGGRPFTVVRGLAERVLPAGQHGPGARALVREPGTDMFGLGSREAVVAALTGRDRHAFGAPAALDDLLAALAECGLTATARAGGVEVAAVADDPRLRVLAFAHGWEVDDDRSANSRTMLVPLS